jgi:hypothetical protein
MIHVRRGGGANLTYDEMEGACGGDARQKRKWKQTSPYPTRHTPTFSSVCRGTLYYLSAALIDVDERTSRLPSGLRSATRYWMPRSAHWVRLISLSPSSFTK